MSTSPTVAVAAATVTVTEATVTPGYADINSNLNLGLGAILIGVFINCLFLGFILLMSANYYSVYSGDRRLLKILVGVCLVINMLNVVLNIGSIYNWLIHDFGNTKAASVSDFWWNLKSFTGGSIVWLVQGFYAWRIYQLNGNSLYIPILISSVATVQYGFALATTALTFTHHGIIATFKDFTWTITTWLCTAAAGDVIIAASMIFYLRRAQKGMVHSANIISKLFRITLSTNLFTAIVAIVDIICYNVMTNSLHAAFLINLGPLITLGLLVSLNSRKHLKQHIKGIRHVPNAAAGGNNGYSGYELSNASKMNESTTSSTAKETDDPYNKRGGIQVFTNTEIARENLNNLVGTDMEDFNNNNVASLPMGNTTEISVVNHPSYKSSRANHNNNNKNEKTFNEKVDEHRRSDKSKLSLSRSSSESSSESESSKQNNKTVSASFAAHGYDEYGTRPEVWAQPPATSNDNTHPFAQPQVTVHYPQNLQEQNNTSSFPSTPTSPYRPPYSPASDHQDYHAA